MTTNPDMERGYAERVATDHGRRPTARQEAPAVTTNTRQPEVDDLHGIADMLEGWAAPLDDLPARQAAGRLREIAAGMVHSTRARLAADTAADQIVAEYPDLDPADLASTTGAAIAVAMLEAMLDGDDVPAAVLLAAAIERASA